MRSPYNTHSLSHSTHSSDACACTHLLHCVPRGERRVAELTAHGAHVAQLTAVPGVERRPRTAAAHCGNVAQLPAAAPSPESSEHWENDERTDEGRLVAGRQSPKVRRRTSHPCARTSRSSRVGTWRRR